MYFEYTSLPHKSIIPLDFNICSSLSKSYLTFPRSPCFQICFLRPFQRKGNYLTNCLSQNNTSLPLDTFVSLNISQIVLLSKHSKGFGAAAPDEKICALKAKYV